MNLKIEYTEKDMQELLDRDPYETDKIDPCFILICSICPMYGEGYKCDPKKLYDLILSEGITLELKKKEE